MRLNKFEIDTINKLAKKHFGDGTSVYLFGSRTDDRKKGGDIDLFIGNDNEEVSTLEAKVGFPAELKTKIGEQKIDVVFDNANTRQKESFYRSIIRDRVKL